MSVRIASIELTGLQTIHTDEGQRAVKQELPGAAGSFIQELGRSSAALALEGLMLGDGALDALESLRQAQVKAEPVSFAADVIAGVDFTDVLIDSLNVRQMAGHRNRYWYRIDVHEHVEPPEPPGAALAQVDAGVEADAASWSGGAVGAAGAMQDIATLPEMAELDPGVLGHLSSGDLAGALGSAAAGLTGGQLDSIASALGIDPATVDAIGAKLENVQLSDAIAAYNAIKDPSSIPELLKDKPGLLDRLGVGDLGNALAAQADALTGGQLSGVLQSLGNVDPAKLVGLVNELRNADSLGELVQKLAEGGVDIVADLTGIDLGAAAALVQGIAGGVDFIQAAQAVVDKAGALVSQLRAFDPLAAVRALTGTTTSAASDIVRSTRELIAAVDELLSTSTVDAVVAVARQVGCQDQVDSVADLLLDGLAKIDEMLGGIEEPLLQLGVLSGLLDLTGSLVQGLDRIASTSAEDLAALGLSDAKDAAGPLSKTLGFGRDVLAGGAAVLGSAPSVESVDALRADLTRLGTSLRRYQAPAPGGAA